MSYMCPNFTIEETPETVPVLLAGAVPMVSHDAGMADVIESFLTSQIPNKKTARGYRRHITAAMDMMGVERFSQLEPVHLMNYRSELMADTRGLATHAQALIALRSFLTWGAALRGHVLSMDQCLYLLKVPKVTVITPHDTLSAEEIIRYLDAAKRSGPRDLALVIVALGSGVRVAELCAIDIKDIRTDASGGTTIHVRQGKGSKDRMIPVRPEVGKAIDAYLKASFRKRGDGGALFLPEDRAMGSRDTWRLTTKSASRTVKWLADQAGIKKRISPHALRHTFAFTSYMYCRNLVAIQDREPMIAALFVEKDGCYYGHPNIDPWDITRDARAYLGPHPVVAHPPCERWGRFSDGSPMNKTYTTGDDGGCFKSALASLRRWGGVLEHPAHSKAWAAHGLVNPLKTGWLQIGYREWVCQVEQGHYGHVARKATWLLVVGERPPELIWGPAPQRIPQKRLEERGRKSAVRCGMVAYQSKLQRQRTPPDFRDLLIELAQTVAQAVA